MRLEDLDYPAEAEIEAIDRVIARMEAGCKEPWITYGRIYTSLVEKREELIKRIDEKE